MRALSSIAALGLALLSAPLLPHGFALAQQGISAGQGTGSLFQMTPPLPGGTSSTSSPNSGTSISTSTGAAAAPAPLAPASPTARPSTAGTYNYVPATSSPGSAANPPTTTLRPVETPVTGVNSSTAQAPAASPSATSGGSPGSSPSAASTSPSRDSAGSPPAAASTADPFQMRPGQPAPRAAIRPVDTTPPPPSRPDRFIIPQQRMIFAGEISSRSWTLYVSEEEAQRASGFLLSYLNSVLVMPETSRIRVTINGQTIVESPLASSQEPARLQVPMRRGTLRTGANLIRVDVVQRHRTDCAVTATYELWTEINNEGSGITFDGGAPTLVGGLDSLPAVGFDEKGVTTIRVVTPGPIEGGGSSRVLRVVQGLSVRGLFPNPAVVIADGTPGTAPPGTLTVVVGSASELPRLMASVPAEARQRPITSFVKDERLGAPTLLISGPSASDVDRAIDRLNNVSIEQTDAVNTSTRWSPNAPLFNGARTVRFSDLGIPTQEFSGRRFRAEFQIALPPDFFAEAYGNASLLLDAAFTGVVRQGSHVDLYVNQQIASNLPITKRGGGLFEHQRMQVPLRNFRPGINRLFLEVILDTESDARCLPGATLPADNRFVLFDSTEFSMDNFARIGRVPNLAALTADAFPYSLDGSPVAVVLARPDSATLSAAATLMSRLALSNGAPLPMDASPASVTLGERNAIFVGGIDQISSAVLEQVGISESTRANWVVSVGDDAAGDSSSENYDSVLAGFRSRQTANTRADVPSEQPSLANTPEVYDRWRENVQGKGGLYAIAEGFEGWLQRTFSIGFESLRIQEGRRTLYEPPPRTSVLMAQGNSTDGQSTWTLVAGRTAETLAAAMPRFTSDNVWNRIGGQAVAYQSSSGEVERRDIASFRLIITQPLGFSNIRMIAANWFSTNIVPYALILMIAGMVLGIATTFLLHRLGRPT
ncbi:cellulose biosynthesis cyclic di-GMP-binding regulatory protein BcsB [Ancylobacter sp. G4_0304]|uniref:cellulose biosynthesis cyclic di-GMP-binding regulatory protein BcsB n=1 Tax=Ancylobacter sp. G4_0304 TaxID=3114289 RepID=UPI0039C606FA